MSDKLKEYELNKKLKNNPEKHYIAVIKGVGSNVEYIEPDLLKLKGSTLAQKLDYLESLINEYKLYVDNELLKYEAKIGQLESTIEKLQEIIVKYFKEANND